MFHIFVFDEKLLLGHKMMGIRLSCLSWLLYYYSVQTYSYSSNPYFFISKFDVPKLYLMEMTDFRQFRLLFVGN